MFFKNLKDFTHTIALSFVLIFALSSCGDDGELQSTTFNYTIHNGQTVASAPYDGIHPNDFTASMKVDEMENGNTMITVTLNNTISGATYNMHAHDAEDASTTPNGTPYNESPNADIFAQPLVGNGNTVMVSQEALISYDDLVSDYEGFFVIHDPLRAVSTVNIGTYLVVGSFARAQSTTSYATSNYDYAFNTGQVAAAFAYAGAHSTDLSANIQVDELADGKSRITIRLDNTIDGETYPTHAHDMADAATTPNGTPYNESPNGDVFAASILGNGGLAGTTSISDFSFDEITTNYDGFFVVHDPLQTITTVDPTTYVILGVFAR